MTDSPDKNPIETLRTAFDGNTHPHASVLRAGANAIAAIIELPPSLETTVPVSNEVKMAAISAIGEMVGRAAGRPVTPAFPRELTIELRKDKGNW